MLHVRAHYQRVRTALLPAVPMPIRLALSWLRNRHELLDSALRRYLPQRLGGRFAELDRSVECRRVVPDELEVLRGVRQGTDPDCVETRARRSDIDDEANATTQFCVGVYVDGRMVGCGWCVSVGDAGARPFRHTLLLSDFVQPAFRRRGLAQRLHAARMALLAARFAETAFAWVDTKNAASLAGFKARGFTLVPQTSWPSWLTPPTSRYVLLSRSV